MKKLSIVAGRCEDFIKRGSDEFAATNYGNFGSF